jgi:hypothetical protein
MSPTPRKPAATVAAPLPLDGAPGNAAHPAHPLLDQIQLMAAHGHTELRATIDNLVKQIRQVL